MKKGVKELTEGMQRLCAVANRIVSGGGKNSRIEVDLLLDNLRHLYDIALQLEQDDGGHDDQDLLSSAMMATRAAMSAKEADIEPAAAQEAPVQPAAVEETPADEQPTPEPVAEPEDIIEEAPASEQPKPVMVVEEFEAGENNLLFDEIVIEPVAQPANSAEKEIESEQPIPEPAQTPEPKPEPIAEPEEKPAEKGGQASLLDYLKHPADETPGVRTLGESPAGSTAGSSLERKVTDLRTVININDKFSFITELFRGNMRGYNDFIMQLSEIEEREEALGVVSQIAEQYKWDEGSQAVKAFYKIFDKKF